MPFMQNYCFELQFFGLLLLFMNETSNGWNFHADYSLENIDENDLFA